MSLETIYGLKEENKMHLSLEKTSVRLLLATCKTVIIEYNIIHLDITEQDHNSRVLFDTSIVVFKNYFQFLKRKE